VTSFKQYLSEDRDPDLKYTEVLKKGKLDRLIVKLEGVKAGPYSKAAKRMIRLLKLAESSKKKGEEIKDSLRADVEGLFDASDEIVTRVVETASFVITVNRKVAPEDKETIDHEAIATDLMMLIERELKDRLEELKPEIDSIYKQHTKLVKGNPKAAGIAAKEKVDESLMPSVVGAIKSFVKFIKSWAKKFDRKLLALKKRAKVA
jgi:hypothetical protein